MTMNHPTKTLRYALASLLILGACAFTGGLSTAYGQKTGRDPFSKYVPPRVPVKKSGLVTPPTIQERIAQYKAQKQAAMSARVAAPKPTTAFLLSEMQVVGISRSPRGYAAIVEATPIKLAYVIYPGEKFYDGQLVAIEDNRLVFRRETVFSDGKRERSVEMKPLRQATTVDALAAGADAPASAAAAETEKPEPKPTAQP
jgi:hypothetical protein